MLSSRDGRVAIYDTALAIVEHTFAGDRARAGELIARLARIQSADGSLPFSFTPRQGEMPRYIRVGALAWVGYAAAVYLDTDAIGPYRAEAIALAHKAAGHILSRQVQRAGDPRDGLVVGGEGTYRYQLRAGRVEQVFLPGDLAWASTEHNIDTYFFLSTLARVTSTPRYKEAAERVRDALVTRVWNPSAGQLHRGMTEQGPDVALSLDCASWGALFLSAIGERIKAETSLAVADTRYASVDRRTGARGHRPYAHLSLYEDEAIARAVSPSLPSSWDNVDAVWPEGSAGVALAAWRMGHKERARDILSHLEPIRAEGGVLPTFTMEIPFEMDTAPSVAGSVWVRLVEREIARGRPLLWAP